MNKKRVIKLVIQLVITISALALLSVGWKFIYPPTMLFLKLNTNPLTVVDTWQGKNPRPKAFIGLKQLAIHLLRLPENDRQRAISVYNLYSCEDTDPSFKLFILMRLLYHVPEEYSGGDAAKFDIFLDMFGERNLPTGTFNYLWPLGYDGNGVLVLVHNVEGAECLGLCRCIYHGNQEYQYFSTHFPLRKLEELR